MALDPVFLSRLQFALTIGFHYLFPPLTIGIGVQLAIMEGMYLKTKDRQYEVMAKFWTKIFGLIFAVGVASGIVMEFQFGTNWAAYSRFVGDVFGSPLAAEGIFAFFLESGFLAVLIFGWDRVSPRMHFFATCMVALGSMFSAVWIVIANAWQQTPAGYKVTGEGLTRRAELTAFWNVVFSPSSMDALIHALIGAFILGGFFVMSVSAYYLLKGRHEDFARKSIGIALPFAAVFSIGAIVSGDLQARMITRMQPGKMAAFEGHFHSEPGKGAAFHIFGFPDERTETVRYGLAVPGGLSFLVHGNFHTPVMSLDNPGIVPGGVPPGESVRDYWPPVNMTFQFYHIMVGLGVLFIILTVYAIVLKWRGTLFQKRWLMWIFVFAVAGPVISNQTGWYATEVGRQPWIVYGLLKTAHGASESVSGAEVLTSIFLFALIYLLLFLVWLFVMDRKIRTGPEKIEAAPAEGPKDHWMDTAARYGDRASRESLTDVREDKKKDDTPEEP